MSVIYYLQKIKNPFLMSIIIFILAFVFLSASIRDMLKFESPMVIGHTGISVSLAVNATFCHKVGYISQNAHMYRVVDFFQKNTSDMTMPLVEVIMRDSGTVDLQKYCKMVTKPLVQPENTLSWIMQGLMKVKPTLSFREMVLSYFILQMVMMWFFFYYLISIKIPSFYVLIIAIVSITTLSVQMPVHVIDRYAMLLPAVLFLIGALGFSVKFEWYKYNNWCTAVFSVLFSLFIGVYVFLLYNLRTTYIIVAALVLIIYFLCLMRNAYDRTNFKHARKISGQLIIIITTAFCCYNSVQSILIPSELKSNNASNLTYHVIMHPVVLSLAVPTSEFSRSQGIAWDDLVGIGIAKKLDPEVGVLKQSLTYKYETTLFAFYKSLWKKHPREMAHVYYEKFKMAAASIELPGSLSIFSYPLNQFSGINISLLQLLLLIFLIRKRVEINTNLFFLGVAFSFVGIALYFESGIVMSAYFPVYHAFLTLWVVVLNLIFIFFFIRAWLFLDSRLLPVFLCCERAHHEKQKNFLSRL